ncbi:hypothetical protein [Crossiella cryophila]|uniref:Uncharacterized protein n=1 Tax=Crossiella cryophila TaxID=43355 RepID=A0A7W7FTN7_9PSEU|nr:hypothetical protein [Crossiella cryophila]MBB4676613.1 hypothetical protein [Crossiella cryophila]
MPDTLDLSALGNIDPAWTHLRKQVTPAAELALPDARLKWYDVHRPDQPIPAATRTRAREFLAAEVAAGRVVTRGDLGFIVLHSSGTVLFALLCLWRGVNEMWQAAYASTDGGPFTPAQQADGLTPTQCVWELGPTTHERMAWSHYLESARDQDAKLAYLADRLTGLV